MVTNLNPTVPVLAGLLDSIIEELGAKDRREHERRMKELQIIENSSLRDEYVKQLLLDRLLAPIEQAHYNIQNTAKHLQWLAPLVMCHHHDHGLTEEQGYELATQLQQLAILITNIDTLHDLKFAYAVTTLMTSKIYKFRHRDLNLSIGESIRKGVLEPLNTCIATQKNFEIRLKVATLLEAANNSSSKEITSSQQ
jgi:hypothetical protein